MKERKKQMRCEVAQHMETLHEDYLAKSDEDMLAHLLALPELKQAKTVFCYVSIKREPDTRKLIEHMLQQGKRVCVPYTLPGGQMQAKQITTLNGLEERRLGLLEPHEDAPVVEPEEMDFMVLPSVTCDRSGNRLGHGGGYYDRFLAKANCPNVCLCRDALIREDIPLDTHDMPVHMVLTEKGCFPKKTANT